jgi:hypothetical protein
MLQTHKKRNPENSIHTLIPRTIMISNADFNAISDLDLDLIKMKLMHEPSGEGWNAAKADSVEREYRRFLYLMKQFPTDSTVPLADVDTFWHYHILDTMKYASDCAQVFGYFLHHCPYAGLDSANDDADRALGGERMQELYEAAFGESYSMAAETIAQAGTSRGAQAGRDCRDVLIQVGNFATVAQSYGVAANQDAYCTAARPAASNDAYCSAAQAVTKSGADCSASRPTGGGNAYCSAAGSVANSNAYCSAAGPVANGAAYYSATGSAPKSKAYCSATRSSAGALAYCTAAAPAANSHAYCTAAGPAVRSDAYCTAAGPAVRSDAYCTAAAPAVRGNAYRSATTLRAACNDEQLVHAA